MSLRTHEPGELDSLDSLLKMEDTNVTENDKETGRQDHHAPEANLEESNPIPVQQAQGQRLWLWISVVAVIFVIVAVIAVSTT